MPDPKRRRRTDVKSPNAPPSRQAARTFFLSYARGDPDDEALAKALFTALRGKGHDVFLDVAMKPGTKWAEEIPQRLAACDVFIVLLSANSVHSEMVLEEVRLAREQRKARGGPVWIPVRVKYSGPLTYALGAWLNPYQAATWQSKEDTSRILQETLDATEGRVQSPAPVAPDSIVPVTGKDFARPEPIVDLTAIAAPGGSIRPDDPFYIERAADAEVLETAHRLEETIVIKAPRQLGKSSLLKRYLAACRRAGKKTALIDLSLFSDQDLADYPTFLTFLASEVLDRLEPDATVRPDVRGQPDMTRFVERKVLQAVPDHVVLAFDEVDRVLGKPYQSGFFSMLRYWHERRTDGSLTAFARLELGLVISTEPYLLIADALRSPFNVRAPIELHPFNAEECRELNRRHHNFLSEEQVEQLRALLNGHPYLTRLAYYRLTRPKPIDFAALIRVAASDDGPFGDHLRTLLAKLKQHPGQDLLAALRQVIAQGTTPNDDAYYRLKGAGLVRRENDRIVPANGLYARFFGGLR
jgi:AAA-like domain/TIR domain